MYSIPGLCSCMSREWSKHRAHGKSKVKSSAQDAVLASHHHRRHLHLTHPTSSHLLPLTVWSHCLYSRRLSGVEDISIPLFTYLADRLPVCTVSRFHALLTQIIYLSLRSRSSAIILAHGTRAKHVLCIPTHQCSTVSLERACPHPPACSIWLAESERRAHRRASASTYC